MSVNKYSINSLFLVFLTLLLASSFSTYSHATVSIVKGKTTIPHGNAISSEDLTIRNDKLAFSIAVGSAPPWGVARGCIVDIANVLPDGSLSNDRVAFADFIPNRWSSWPNSYHNVDIVKDSDEEAIIKITRDFAKVTITTQYSLSAGSDLIHVETTMLNNGDSAIELVSGYTLWPDSGYKFAVPKKASRSADNDTAWLSDRFVGYGENWAIALHAPYMTEVENQSRDLFAPNRLQSAESVAFSGDYQVLDSGDLAPVVNAEIKRKNLAKGTLKGLVTTPLGRNVASAAIVVMQEGIPYMWALAEDNRYEFDLPVGDYEVYATGKRYSDSPIHKVNVAPNKTTSLSFDELREPGNVTIRVTDANTDIPLDAKVKIEKGNQPLIEYLGARTFFTQLDNTGYAQFSLAPGDYTLKVSHGDGFNAKAEIIQASVNASETASLNVAVDVLTYPTKEGWYAGDLHHHADVLEGSTSPEYLARSQLASGLNVLFVSDHDSTKNNQAIQALANKRDVPFIPSIEISPSWGHFNAFPIDSGATLSVDPGKDDIHRIIDDVRRMGAIVIASNHPYIPYGYLSSLEKGTAPGGFNPDIDLFEINAVVPNKPTFEKMHQLWSEGLPYYLTAGSDTHDVLNEASGVNRMFVYTASKPNAKAYAQALKDGHAYVSFGPVMYPQNVMFGDTVTLTENQPQSISIDVAAVNGLKQVKLIGNLDQDDKQKSDTTAINKNSRILDERLLTGNSASVTFTLPESSGWVALELEDKNGRKAYSNPIWLEVVNESQF